jgi:hypothetical protein
MDLIFADCECTRLLVGLDRKQRFAIQAELVMERFACGHFCLNVKDKPRPALAFLEPRNEKQIDLSFSKSRE